MTQPGILELYLDALLNGDRAKCRALIEKTLQSGTPANGVYLEIIWPIMVEIEKLLRHERISPAQEHMAIRINRTIVDQLQNKLPRHPVRNKKVVICCAAEELHELGAQVIADLFESDGWEVKFIGSGLTNDDILAFVHGYHPDILLIYGTAGSQAPAIRRLIDTVRDVNAWPEMKIMVSGGIFNRADGLWQEIGADLFAATAQEAMLVASGEYVPEPEERSLNRRKRKTKKAANLATAGVLN